MFPTLPNSRDVEVALRRHPCVWDAAAVEVTDHHGHLVMAAVVQLTAPLPDAAAELAEYCRVLLPAGQVPARWVVSGPDEVAGQPAPDLLHAAARIPPQAHRAPHLDA
jgi:acyl-CoA synthetase (AMP-forming)/AMP-acid ligase II